MLIVIDTTYTVYYFNSLSKGIKIQLLGCKILLDLIAFDLNRNIGIQLFVHFTFCFVGSLFVFIMFEIVLPKIICSIAIYFGVIVASKR